MNVIDKFRNGILKVRQDIKKEKQRTARTRQELSTYGRSRGVFEIQDIFYMFIVGIMIYIFTQIWNPVLALFNFTSIAYGGILELVLNMFALIIAAGYIAYMVKKWQSPQ